MFRVLSDPGDDKTADTRAAQTRDFKSLMDGIDSHIPLVCICGNHDVGNTPTRATIESYARDFGDDYFSFWVGGVRFISLNTQMHSDPSAALELAEAQDQWIRPLGEELDVKEEEGLWVPEPGRFFGSTPNDAATTATATTGVEADEPWVPEPGRFLRR